MSKESKNSKNKNIPQRLKHDQLLALTCIEQYWHRFSKFPTEAFIQKSDIKLGDFDLEENLKHPTFLAALSNRGIELPDLSPSALLTNEQIAAITTVLNFDDTRSRTVKLRELGISPTKWGGWMKNPRFKEFLHSVSTINFEDSIHTAHEGLIRAVERGSVDAVKFYLELTGRYDPKASSQEIQNVKLLLAHVLESIQRHVKDPEVIKAISFDFEQILSGAVSNSTRFNSTRKELANGNH